MEGPGIPTHRRQAAPPGPVREPAEGRIRHGLALHAPAMAAPSPVLGHVSVMGAAVPVAALLVAAHVLATVALAAVRQWFWWRARSQPARDLRWLLRHAESAQAAERLAEGLAARQQAVIDAYVRAHDATGRVPRPPRRASRRPDDVPRRSRRSR